MTDMEHQDHVRHTHSHMGPNPDAIYPNENIKSVVFIKNVISALLVLIKISLQFTMIKKLLKK